jgi:hypothetical protein
MFVDGYKPQRCPAVKCKSRRWDSGGQPVPVVPLAEAKPPETSTDRLKEITAGRNLDAPPPKKPPVAELPVNSFMGEVLPPEPVYEICGRLNNDMYGEPWKCYRPKGHKGACNLSERTEYVAP